MSDHIARVYGDSLRKKIVTVPTRVDLTTFSLHKTTYEIGPVLQIVSVGGFVAVKNHLALIKDLHDSGIPFQLTLVGSGPMESAYRAAADALGIRDKIVLTGVLPQKQIASILPTMDIYVHYSLTEALSRAVLEAMAVGLPVVATRAGFVRDVLLHDTNAVVLDAPGSLALGHAIRRLATSESLRRQLGEAARHFVELGFEWNKVFDQYRAAIIGAA
jgi:glycosyltransferase involved in cell wall biosynthesis